MKTTQLNPSNLFVSIDARTQYACLEGRYEINASSVDMEDVTEEEITSMISEIITELGCSPSSVQIFRRDGRAIGDEISLAGNWLAAQ